MREAFRGVMVLLLLLLLAAGPAWADPFTLVSLAIAGAQAVGYIIPLTAFGLSVGVAVVGATANRRKQRKAAAAQRAAYNASLQDRTLTLLRADPPWRVVYGVAITGGDILDMFTHDKVNARKEDGSTYTKPDALKTLVIHIASHEVDAIEEIYIDGVPLGALDANGVPTSGEFANTSGSAAQDSRTVTFTGSITLTETPLAIMQAYSGVAGGDADTLTAQTVTISGNTLNGPPGIQVRVDYTVAAASTAAGAAKVRVAKFLGTPGQTTPSYLAALDPARYTGNHRLREIAGVAITLDLEEQRFQGGPPGITFRVRGRKVYDPRDGITRWDDNPALCIRDFLAGPWGYEVATADIDDATVIAAANACIELITLEEGATSTPNQRRYTCNGSFTTDGSPEAVLEDLAECMAGSVSYGAKWMLSAGVWTPPVMTLTDDDLHGQIEVVQADTPMGELFNGLRGQFFKYGAQSPSEFNPYSNTTFVAADGRQLWSTLDLPFTNVLARARNLCRIFVERNRSGQVIRYPAKLKAWPLQIGDRVNVTSAEYGLSAKPYRVTDWQFDTTSAVVLTLEEDEPGIYDLADAAVADPTPNTGLPNPWAVAPLASLTATSGNATLQVQGDGTVVPRVLVQWPLVSDASVSEGGSIEVLWRVNGSTVWNPQRVAGSETFVYLTGVREGDPILIEARARNTLGAASSSIYTTHVVVGKLAAPSDVTGLAWEIKPAQVAFKWDPCPDADYAATELRYGSTWALGELLWKGSGREYQHPRPDNGIYTVWAAHQDTSGNYSAAPTPVVVTVDNSIDPGAASAQVLTLLATSPAFLFDSTAATTSTSPTITFTAVLANVSGTATFTAEAFNGAGASLGLIALGGTGNTRTLTAAQFVTYSSTRYVRVTATLGLLSDITSVYRADNGSAGLILYLSNQAHTVPTAADGSGGNYGGAFTAVKMYEGFNDVTALWSFSIAVTSATATINGGAGPVTGTGSITVAVSNMSADSARVEITAARVGYPTLPPAVFSLSKSKQGASTPGSPGPAGRSARRAYALYTGNPVVSGAPVTTAGDTSLPSAGAWTPGAATSYTSGTQNPGIGQSLFQTDGIFDPATGLTTWQVPYLSNFKVGNLAALSAVVDGLQSVTIFDPVSGSSLNRQAALGINTSGGAEVGAFAFSTAANRPALQGQNASGYGVFGYGDTGVWGRAATASGTGVLGTASGAGSRAVAGRSAGNGSWGGFFDTGGSGGGASNIGLHAVANNSAHTALQVDGTCRMNGQTIYSSTAAAPLRFTPVSANPTPVNGGVAVHATWGLIVSDGVNWYRVNAPLVTV